MYVLGTEPMFPKSEEGVRSPKIGVIDGSGPPCVCAGNVLLAAEPSLQLLCMGIFSVCVYAYHVYAWCPKSSEEGWSYRWF